MTGTTLPTKYATAKVVQRFLLTHGPGTVERLAWFAWLTECTWVAGPLRLAVAVGDAQKIVDRWPWGFPDATLGACL